MTPARPGVRRGRRARARYLALSLLAPLSLRRLNLAAPAGEAEAAAVFPATVMDELLLAGGGEEDARSERSFSTAGDDDGGGGGGGPAERLKSRLRAAVSRDAWLALRNFAKRNGLLTLSVAAVLSGCALGFMLRGTQLSPQVPAPTPPPPPTVDHRSRCALVVEKRKKGPLWFCNAGQALLLLPRRTADEDAEDAHPAAHHLQVGSACEVPIANK